MEEGFWNNPSEAEAFLKKLSTVKYWVNSIERIDGALEDLQALYDMVAPERNNGDWQENSPEEKDLDAEYAKVLGQIEELEVKSMLGGEGDNLGALLKINSGAGGTESTGGRGRVQNVCGW